MPATAPESQVNPSRPAGIDHTLEAQYRTASADLLRLIRDLSGCAMVLITSVNTEQKSFENWVSLGASTADYDLAICALTLLSPDDVLVVRDVRSDIRLSQRLPTKTVSEKFLLFPYKMKT